MVSLFMEVYVMAEPASGLLAHAAAIILCGGKGTRMGSDNRHKVCFPIDGEPAIVRTVRTLESRGIRRIVIVVGAKAGDVVATVGQEFPNTLFVYQAQQRGTGHAAQIAARALHNIGFEGPILLTMGDKLIEPRLLDHLAEKFIRQRADLAFITGPKAGNSSNLGRIVTDKNGLILGNFEVRDIELARIYGVLDKMVKMGKSGNISYAQVLEIGQKYIPNEQKLIKALGPLAEELKKAGSLTKTALAELLPPQAGEIVLAGQAFTADELEKAAKTVNLSVYLANSKFWYEILPALRNDNAQGEYYLPDIITMGGANPESGWKMQQYQITDPSELMAYNSPDELLFIEDTLRRKALRKTGAKSETTLASAVSDLSAQEFRQAGKWLELLEKFPPKLVRRFTEIYGPDKKLHNERRKIYIRALKLFIERYGADRKVIIVRAPGRINLMGRHVDHRGGAVNVLAIDRDVVFVASPRNDDVVHMCNADADHHPDREFSIGQMLGEIEWEDWLSFVNSEYVRRMIAQTRGDWSNYVKAALLRLQQSFQQVRLLGFDAAICGDIPQAAGLSSSSALVVATAETAKIFNGLKVDASELVDLCGQGEWFVGSRGGSADHAAIRMGKRGQIAHVKFFPFEVAQTYSFPDSCRLVIANSGINAHKSSTAKDQFNQKVASYEFGFMLLRDRNEQYANLLEHLRDANPRKLNCLVSQVYKLLRSVPEELPTETIRDLLSAHREKVDRILSSHNQPEKYDLRAVLMYGMAECERSLMAPKLLSENEVEKFGKLMLVSHDGDRVSRHEPNGKKSWQSSPFTCNASDAAMEQLCQDLISEDPERVSRAQLYMQPGGYGCSTKQIDHMIDIVRTVPGCHGAQLGGAGLGGCIMILAETEAGDAVVKSLTKNYYEPAGLEPMIHVCQPVEGSGMLRV
jgi:N-acetylgalactosamine kinase